MIEAAIFLIFPLCLAAAALTDLFTMTIPNRIPAILLASFLVIAPFSGMDWPTIGMSAAAAFAVFAVCFALFAINVMGGGDAKLLTAASIWFGYHASLIYFLGAVSVIGGIVTLVIVILRTQADTVMAMGLPLPHSLTVAKKIPYGVAIGIGGFLTYDQAPILLIAMRGLH
jgi:prepilin peptidase CpaA